jgi:AcrR family transcriptional regulator
MSQPSQDKALTKKRRDRSVSEEKLLTAGIHVISRYGFKGATTKMIAKKAGVNEALIGRYFNGKEGLLIAIIQRFLTDVHEQELNYPPQETLEEELLHFLEFKVTLTSKEKNDLGKIIITYALNNLKFKKKLIEEIPMELDEKLLERLRLLQSKGKISSDIKIEDICEEIETYSHGAFIFNVHLMDMSKEELAQKMQKFIRHYARGL